MAATNRESSPLIGKLVALVVVILGFLIVASGYRYDSTLTMIGGLVVLGLGIVVLARAIARRNSAAA